MRGPNRFVSSLLFRDSTDFENMIGIGRSDDDGGVDSFDSLDGRHQQFLSASLTSVERGGKLLRNGEGAYLDIPLYAH
jgi:hypothetical protein